MTSDNDSYPKMLRELEEIEIQMDEANSSFGDELQLCLYCHSEDYDSISGIVHDSLCAVIRARKMIKLLKEGGA